MGLAPANQLARNSSANAPRSSACTTRSRMTTPWIGAVVTPRILLVEALRVVRDRDPGRGLLLDLGPFDRLDPAERLNHVGDRMCQPNALFRACDANSTVVEHVEEALQDRALIAQERGLGHVQRPRESGKRLDRWLDVTVLVSRKPSLRDARELLEL